MSNQSNSEQSKTVVDAYYQAGVEGRLREFARYLHPDFTTTAPNYLPWGGFHPGAAFFRDKVLPFYYGGAKGYADYPASDGAAR
jgi:hypothetical protein